MSPKGYFTAALAAVNTTSNALAQDTLEYATCLWTRDVCNVSSQQRKANAAPKSADEGPPRRVHLSLDADVPPANLQVSLALLVAGDTDQAVRAVSALAALYKRADHAECMERMIGAPP